MEPTYKQSFGTTWSFIAMEYYLGILNRTYQIFVTPTVIAGGLVKNLTAAPPYLPPSWFDPLRYTRKRLVNKYQHLSPESPEFKRQALFNFQYSRGEIQKAWYDPTLKWGMGTIAHSGKLNIQLTSGKKREFILLGLQQGQEILQHLQEGYNSSHGPRDFSEIHQLIEQVYEYPDNFIVWTKLTELFHNQGEYAQEHYCHWFTRTLEAYRY